MNKQNYNAVINVKATPKEAFKKIAKVDKWWAKNFIGKAEKLNNKFSVHFGETFVDFQISELIPNKKVVWKVTDCNLNWINNKKEWSGSEVVFEISENGNSTQIDFTHFDLVPGVECYNDCEIGWNGHIKESLVDFINENKGQPQ